MKTESSILLPVSDLVKNGAFSYGMTTASQLENSSLNRSSRVMIKRLNRLISALDLPFAVSENTKVISHDNGNTFTQLHGKERSFFVMARDPIEGNSITDIVNKNPINIDFITGICLYSADSVHAVGEDGSYFLITSPKIEVDKPILSIEINDRLSIYETESILRLSQFISDLSANSTQIRKLIVNNPKVEYYLYILDAFSKGLLSSKLALEWFEKVDLRNQKLFDLLRKRVTKPNIILPSMPLEPIKDYIKEMVALRELPSIEETKRLLENKSPLWRDIFSVQDPKSWSELNFLAYAYAYLEAGETIDSEKPHLLVAVENPTESKIFALSKKIIPEIKAKNGKRYNIIALYPHEKVLPIGSNTNRTMYHLDAPNGNALTTAKIIFSAYKKEDNQ